MDPKGPIGSICTLSELHVPTRVDLVHNYHLAGDPLELPKGPLGVHGQQCVTTVQRREIITSVTLCLACFLGVLCGVDLRFGVGGW